MNSSENIFLKDKINRYIAVKGFIKTCGYSLTHSLTHSFTHSLTHSLRYGEGYDKRDITVPGVKLLDSKYSEAHPVQFNDCSIPANLMSVFISSRGIPVGIEKYNVKSAYVLMVKVLAPILLLTHSLTHLTCTYQGSKSGFLRAKGVT
jgi:hypothetical protein